MINLDYPELLQLEFILEQTKDKMFMGGEIRRHAYKIYKFFKKIIP